ncbi:unnamed protein product, partial [Porites lobata]
LEAKFYKEIEKSMRIKTVKDFESVLRTKINDELELERKKNQYLSRILLSNECDLWEKIRDDGFNWLSIMDVYNSLYQQVCDKKSYLGKELDIYTRLLKVLDELKVSVEEMKNLAKDLNETSSIDTVSDDEDISDDGES